MMNDLLRRGAVHAPTLRRHQYCWRSQAAGGSAVRQEQKVWANRVLATSMVAAASVPPRTSPSKRQLTSQRRKIRPGCPVSIAPFVV